VTITNGYTTLAKLQQRLLDEAVYTAATISFATTGVVADTAHGLKAFLSNSEVEVSGSAHNNGVFSIKNGGNRDQFTVVEALTTEAVGSTVTLRALGAEHETAFLERCIEAASRYIDNKTGYTFYAGSDTRYYIVGLDTDGAWLVLDKPLQTITSVTNGDSTTLTVGTDVVAWPVNGPPYYKLYLVSTAGQIWQYTSDPLLNTVAVVGTWGYASSAPADIDIACQMIAARLVKRKDVVFGKEGVTALGQMILQIPDDPDVANMLSPYGPKL
jgi:hypothetical protein